VEHVTGVHYGSAIHFESNDFNPVLVCSHLVSSLNFKCFLVCFMMYASCCLLSLCCVVVLCLCPLHDKELCSGDVRSKQA